jgi:hypothetical protein
MLFKEFREKKQTQRQFAVVLDAYITIVLVSSEREELRAYAKITNKLANALTHKRTAIKKEMTMCLCYNSINKFHWST